MRRLGFVLIALTLLAGMTGCMISTQEGERTHVNAKAPDEISFHFDTSFNKSLLYGRSVVLLGLAAFFVRAGGRNGGIVPIALAVVLTGAAGAWYYTGHQKLSDYRIDMDTEGMQLRLPSHPTAHIAWVDIQGIDGDGVARDVSLGSKHGLQWSVEWEELTIHLRGDKKVQMDLRPLSMEQRGTLWRAVARFAELEVQEWVEPVRS